MSQGLQVQQRRFYWAPRKEMKKGLTEEKMGRILRSGQGWSLLAQPRQFKTGLVGKELL